jgi:mannobiose 2-epimerase
MWLLVSIVFVAAGSELKSAEPSQTEIRSLHDRIDRSLQNELTEKWYPRSVDKELGGFHQNFGRDWKPGRDDNRFLVYQSRLTWTAAAFARYSPAHREEYHQYARLGVAFIDEVMRDKEKGGFYFIVGPKGEVDDKIGSEKHVYGTAFALYASSVAYGVTKDERALKVARDAFHWIETHAHDKKFGGYFEAFTRNGQPIITRDDSAPIHKRSDRLGVYYGFKTMNSHIHLLEALAEFYRVEPTSLVKERLEETLLIVRDRIAIEPGALNLYLTQDWRAVPAHDSFGHDIETAYLLVEAAEVLGKGEDATTWKMARQLIDHALDWGWDEEYGGFYDKGDSFAGKAYDTTKVWWTQAEGLNTLLLMHRKYGDKTDRYWKAFVKQWNFIEKHLIDPVHGGWYWEVDRAGKYTGDGAKSSQWKANYHTSRAMMNVAGWLHEMDEQISKSKK